MSSSSSSSSAAAAATVAAVASSSVPASSCIELDVPEGWSKHFSNTHKQWYYYNNSDGTRQWTKPIVDTNKKRNYDNIKNDNDNVNITKKERKSQVPYVAIIVPFRDLHIEQKRSQHLERFIPSMSSFFNDNSTITYRIYIIEQSDDKRKFNRGKLLNIGYDISKKVGCEVFIFHDVDLIPSSELIKYYTTKPNDNHPVHIARVWDRYNDNEKYFGGIVAFSKEQYEKINGFPNNFWGWGGEDDEMYNRTKKVGFQRIGPTSGTITDMEEMTLDNKLKFLRDHSKWKCMNKREVLEEHDATWKSNGLSNLQYQPLSQTWKNENCLLVTVDVKENNHWSDLVLGIDNTQLEKPINELKKDFNNRK
jgi:hypothetical protein